jgi:hypothetical protein
MSSNFHYTNGVYSVGQYQMSGKPFATGSLAVDYATPLEVTFPLVTKFVTIKNSTTGSNSTMRVGFSANGVNGTNYYTLENGESYTADIRIVSVFLRGDVSPCTAIVVAGLTGIESQLRTDIGPNYSGSIGVG